MGGTFFYLVFALFSISEQEVSPLNSVPSAAGACSLLVVMAS